jgi:hypothetical protein
MKSIGSYGQSCKLGFGTGWRSVTASHSCCLNLSFLLNEVRNSDGFWKGTFVSYNFKLLRPKVHKSIQWKVYLSWPIYTYPYILALNAAVTKACTMLNNLGIIQFTEHNFYCYSVDVYIGFAPSIPRPSSNWIAPLYDNSRNTREWTVPRHVSCTQLPFNFIIFQTTFHCVIVWWNETTIFEFTMNSQKT